MLGQKPVVILVYIGRFFGIFMATLGVGLFLFVSQAQAATYTVNSTDDTNDGACTNPYVNAANDCTMREAINAANSNAGADTVKVAIDSSFASDGHGQWTTTVTSSYNASTGQVVIDASGMWDTDENRPGFRLYSTSTTIAGLAFSSGAASSQVKGFEIDGYNGGINASAAVSSLLIGTDCDGVNDDHERNVLHNASNHEIRLQGESSIVAGNYIGTATDGLTVTGTTLYGVWISGASADSNTVGLSEGKACTAAQQRNVIGGMSTVNGAGVRIEGTGASNVAGDSTLGPNGNVIAGNFIGIGVDGSTTIANGGPGVILLSNATLNFIGTDGDGIEDASEGNVLSGNGQGVSVLQTGNNRISGNLAGLNSLGDSAVPNTAEGINVRGADNIVGWCNLAINSTLCNDSGTLAHQRNVISGNALDGLRLGLAATDTLVYGNDIGTAADGVTTIANGASGVFIHRTDTGNIIGGSSVEQRNLIQGNVYGVRIDGEFIGPTALGTNQSPAENNTVQYNTILQNGTGIYNYWTENYSTDGPTDNTLANNTIQASTGVGIEVFGSSPTITNNTITANGSYGIYIHPALITYDAEIEPTASAGGDPANAPDDLVSRPQITGNTIASNTSGGIYQLDSRANNYTTLEADNTIGNNNNQFDIQQDWYGSVEILDRTQTPLPSSALASTSARLTTANGSATTYASSSTIFASGLTQNIYGSTGVAYTAEATWPVVSEYVIDVNGNQTNFGPYTVTATGTYQSTTSTSFTFDGNLNDGGFSSALVNGITTDGVSRYQIAKVVASTVPVTPSNTSPSDLSTGQTLAPTLAASAYSDGSGDAHASTTWRVYSSHSACVAGGTGDVLDTTSTSSLTSLTLSSGVLQGETTYEWRVAYTNAFGNRSSFSSCTAFTTIRTAPSFSGTIANQTWAEDTTQSNSFDLDSFFSDAEGEALTFSTLSSDTPAHLTVSIDVNGQVSFTPQANFSGNETTTFRACDTDNECQNSNQVSLTITADNDNPSAPSAGFSPCCGNTTSDLTPELSWSAGSDSEDGESLLSYQIQLGTETDPTTRSTFNLTTAAGVTSTQVTPELSDETTYYYVVRSVDSAGSASDWSPVQQFYVNTANVPQISLSKQVTVASTSWLFHVYQWVTHWSALIPSVVPLPTQAQAPNPQSYSRSGNTVVSNVTPVGVIAVTIETLIGVFLLAFAVAFLILLRQSRNPKQIFSLLFGNPASSFFTLFMGDNITIEAISYAHFKAKLQLTRLLLAAAVVGVAVLLVAHAAFAPSSPIAAKLATQASSGNVEPTNRLSIIDSYQNTGDGDATRAILSDTLPEGTTFVSGSAVVNGLAVSDADFFSGAQIYVSLGTIGDRDSNSATGTVSYQVRLGNPFSDPRLSIPSASLTANELATASTSNSLSFDVVGAQISGNILNATTGVGLSGVHLSLVQNGATIVTHVTNGSGQYSFSGIGSGEYVLSVESVDGFEDATNRQLQIEAGDVLNIDFQLAVIASGGDNVNNNNNANSNLNTNLNTNENINTNVNTNTNTNLNTNANTNVNVNRNVNANLNINLNTNSNTNTGEAPSPGQGDTEFPTIPPLTPEQQQLKDDLASSLDLNSINETQVSSHVLGILGANSLAVVPSAYANSSENILLPDDQDVVLAGHALPGAKVTITICSAAYVQVTQTDDSGAWNMTVPRTLFEEGEHVAVAAAEKDGVTTDDLEIARFVVLDELAITSRPALVIGLNVLLLSLFANLVLWGARRGRLKQGDPLLPEFTPTPEEQKLGRQRFTRAFGLYVLAIAAFVAIFFIPHPRLFNMRSTTPSESEKIVLNSVNQQRVVPGTSQNFRYVSTLHLAGTAPADTQIAITLCPGVTFRSTASGPNGEWALDIPVIVLPKTQFSLQAQLDENDQLGVPHVMAEFKIDNIQVLPRDWTLYFLSGFGAILGSLALWAPGKKENIDGPNDLEPSSVAGAE